MAATRSTSKTEAAGRGGAWVGGMVVFGLAFALTAVACYDPMIADGHLTCTADTDCPSGFFCATTCEPGLCYHKTVAGQQLALTCTVVDTHRSADGGTGGGSGAGAGGVPAGGAGGGGGQTGAGGGGIVGGGGAGASGPGGGGGTIAGVGGHGGAIVGGSGGTTTGGAGMTGGAGATGMGGHVGAGGATAGMGGHTGAGGTIVGGSGGTPGLGGATGAGGKTGMGGAMGLGGAMGQGGAPGLGLGATCSTGTQCASGFCVDKVCCNVACADQCSACDITPGTCSPVASGPAHGTRLACGGTGRLRCAMQAHHPLFSCMCVRCGERQLWGSDLRREHVDGGGDVQRGGRVRAGCGRPLSTRPHLQCRRDRLPRLVHHQRRLHRRRAVLQSQHASVHDRAADRIVVLGRRRLPEQSVHRQLLL